MNLRNFNWTAMGALRNNYILEIILSTVCVKFISFLVVNILELWLSFKFWHRVSDPFKLNFECWKTSAQAKALKPSNVKNFPLPWSTLIITSYSSSSLHPWNVECLENQFYPLSSLWTWAVFSFIWIFIVLLPLATSLTLKVWRDFIFNRRHHLYLKLN